MLDENPEQFEKEYLVGYSTDPLRKGEKILKEINTTEITFKNKYGVN